MTLRAAFLLWDLDSPPNAESRVAQRAIETEWTSIAFDPLGHWAVTDFGEGMIEFWPLETPWPRTFREVSSTIWNMAFTEDLRWLAVCPLAEPARLWPMNAAHGSPHDLVPGTNCASLATRPNHSEIVVGTSDGHVLLCPPDGTPRTLSGGFPGQAQAVGIALDQEGRRCGCRPV